MDLVYGQAGVDQCCSGEGFVAHYVLQCCTFHCIHLFLNRHWFRILDIQRAVSRDTHAWRLCFKPTYISTNSTLLISAAMSLFGVFKRTQSVRKQFFYCLRK